MRIRLDHLLGFTLAGAALALPLPTSAHPVTVDGSSVDWFQRLPSAANVGIIARDATGAGEFIWRDAIGDTRTDLATPEVVADIAAFQITGNATGIGFLLRRQQGVSFASPPIQVQIAIDMDRVDGSGQEYFAEFGDTKVANNARWERLVQTLFGTGGAGKVIDTSFNEVATIAAMPSPAGVNVEMFVPWTALGLSGPPTTPLRFTVATFRTKENSDVTTDIGGPNLSNALDAITDYGDPAAANYPNTYQDVQDLVVDYSFDLHFDAAGEVYAPLVVQRFLSNSGLPGPDEWYTVKNVSPAPLALDLFKLGDEETPDGTEGMFSFPAGTILEPGATFTVARGGATYSGFFGVPPDAELPPGGSIAVPDMVPDPTWTTAANPAMQLTNAGDELLVLGPSNTILDIVTFGTAVYAGVTTFTPAPGSNEVLTRDAASSDTDVCSVDFSNAGPTCTTDAQCGGPCKQCVNNTCESKSMGTSCADADPCNGDEICDGMGACVTSSTPVCDDGDPCTADTCAPVTGCAHEQVAPGTSCSDGDVCNGAEVCDAAGACLPGTPLSCDDMDPCTLDACDPVTGCSNADAPEGTSCSDGDACNGAETCDAAGVCAPGTPLDCDDQNPCTIDTCDPAGGCSHVDEPDGTECPDGDVCNGDEACLAGQCAAGTPLQCDDGNPCTADSCDPARGCQTTNEPEGTACDAGDPCAGFDTCDGQGQCVAGEGGCGGEGGSGGQGGSGGSTGTTTATGTTTSSGDGGSGGGGGSDTLDDGGCGCRAAGSDDRPSSGLVWFSALALAAGIARRRRRG